MWFWKNIWVPVQTVVTKYLCCVNNHEDKSWHCNYLSRTAYFVCYFCVALFGVPTVDRLGGIQYTYSDELPKKITQATVCAVICSILATPLALICIIPMILKLKKVCLILEQMLCLRGSQQEYEIKTLLFWCSSSTMHTLHVALMCSQQEFCMVEVFHSGGGGWGISLSSKICGNLACEKYAYMYVSCPEHSQMFTNLISTCLLHAQFLRKFTKFFQTHIPYSANFQGSKFS